MRFLFDCANMRAQSAPLTEGQPEKEFAYVEIDGEQHQVDAYVKDWEVTQGWQSGTVGYVPLSPLVDGEALADYFESDDFRKVVERVARGTRIETVNGSTVGLIDGDARAAQTELAVALRRLPDHEIRYCTPREWLSRQDDLLKIWRTGAFDEAVDRLEPAFQRTLSGDGVRMLGRWERFGALCDIGDELMDEVRRRFASGGKLYRCHIAALVDFNFISDTQVRAWEAQKTALSSK